MQTRKQKREYTDQEKEYKFARWFNSVPDSSPRNMSKIIITLVACIAIAAIAFNEISRCYSTPTATIAGIGILIMMAVLVNADIRSAVIRITHRGHYEQTKEIESYNDIKYYFLTGRKDVLFVENGRDLTAVGLFKLKAIPLMIQGNFERFIRSLYQQQIPLYWLYGQAPIAEGAILETPAVSDEARAFYERLEFHEMESRMETHGGMWAARIIFGTRCSLPASGNLEVKRLQLYQKLQGNLFKIHTAFVSAYPHTVVEALEDKELEKAFSISITGGGIPAFF